MYYREILSGVWIGDAEIMGNMKFIEDNHIGVVYNCTDIYDFPNCDITRIRLPFSTSLGSENISLIQKNNPSHISSIVSDLE